MNKSITTNSGCCRLYLDGSQGNSSRTIWKGALSALLGVLSVLGCAYVCCAQTVPQCSPAAGNNGSRLCVTLGFRDGKLVADRSLSRLNTSTQFTDRLKQGLTIEKVTAFFLDQIDQALADRPRPYTLALSADDQMKEAAGQLNDALTVQLRTSSKSWQAYQLDFNDWAKAVPGRKGFADVFNLDALTLEGGVYYPLNNIGNTTALLFNDNDSPDGAGYSLLTATFSFSVLDPVKDWKDANGVTILIPDQIDPAKQRKRIERIREKLGKFQGQIWDPVAIKTTIVRYYRQLGLKPTVHISPFGQDLSISIVESPRISRIVLPEKSDSDSDVQYQAALNQILYVLMPDADFRAYIKLQGSSNIANQLTVDYLAVLGHQGPYLDAGKFQVQQLLLTQIGYIASAEVVEESDVLNHIGLVVQKIAEIDKTPEGKDTPKEAAATANDSGVVTAHQQEESPSPDFTPQDKAPGKPLKEKKNYLGGGFEYRPGQGIRVFGLAQRSQLTFPFQAGSLSATGGADSGGIGSFNYFADYVGFSRLHRRVALQLSGSSDSDPNRMIAGQSMDERRTSGLARLEIEAFRDRAGSLLRFHVEGRQALVALDTNNLMPARQHLTTLDVGGLYTFESDGSEHPRRVRLEPIVRFGLGLAAGAPSFTKVTLTGNFHQSLPNRLAADISGKVSSASQHTPMFELPSLGGADTVRGFRHDDGLGRRLWSLQNELWLPLPHTATDAEDGLGPFLRDNLRVAPFIDVGGLYQPTTSKAGVRSGYGMGLRVIYGVIILKLDYAYGVGAAATAGNHGKFYFSIGSNLPF